MSSAPNLEQIATGVVTTIVRDIFNSLLNSGKKISKDTYDRIFPQFSDYMTKTHAKLSKVRILSSQDHDVDLKNIYVGQNFVSGDESTDDVELIYDIQDGSNVIIVGNGGAGKTVFLRHLWLTLFETASLRVPVYIELRRMAISEEFDILEYINHSISAGSISGDVFKRFLTEGKFCFILDGLDELKIEYRDFIQNILMDMSEKFPKCSYVISSRADKRFSGWAGFRVYNASPMNEENLVALIKKVPFNEDTKELFLGKINSEFFEEHEQFLSNPLLAIMMLMTFKKNMDIPKSLTIFYDQAFNTLYQWHDATKSYNRSKKLDINEFRRSFAVFCLLSYYDDKFEFTAAECLRYIEKSSELVGISVKASEILEDYEHSVNLMMQDGLVYVFIHRSFQEYFAAYALVNPLQDSFPRFLRKIRKRISDSVLSMCFELAPKVVVKHYFVPNVLRINEMRQELVYSGKFPTLALLRTRITFRFFNHEGDAKRRGIGLQVKSDDESAEFFANVEGIFFAKPSFRSLGIHMFYHSAALDELFEIADKFDVIGERNEEELVCFNFCEDIVKVYLLSVDQWNVGNAVRRNDATVEGELERLFEEHMGEFERVDAGMGQHIAKMLECVQQRIDAENSAEASLDEILGGIQSEK